MFPRAAAEWKKGTSMKHVSIASAMALWVALWVSAGSASADGGAPLALDPGTGLILEFDTVTGPAPSFQPASAAGRSGEVVALLFDRPIDASIRGKLRRALERRQLTAVYGYLPAFGFLVRSPVAERQAMLVDLGQPRVVPWGAELKRSRALRTFDPRERASHSTVPMMILAYPDADGRALDEGLERLEITPVGRGKGPWGTRIRTLVEPSRLVALGESLAQLDDVIWVDLEGRRALLNDTTVWVGQEGLDGSQGTPIFDHGLHGEGQVVAVLDTGIDPDMCYFREASGELPPINPCDGGTVVDTSRRKILAVNFLDDGECAGGISNFEWDTQDHGSHVAGTVAGDDLANPLAHDTGDGMAPGAKLVIQDGGFGVDDCGDLPGLGCPVVDLKPVFQQAYDQGARIHSNSWGDRENLEPFNIYSVGSEDVDVFTWQHPDFLIVFAAGNSGTSSGTVSSPSTAKNALSVGATNRSFNADTLAFFTGCGPTDDGRIKPDLVVPGFNIVSADNDGNAGSENCTRRSLSGTSMATPGAAGFAALARQYYTDGWYPSGTARAGDGRVPSSALLRATLLNSTQGLEGIGSTIPANCQGWGRLTLDETLYFDGDGRQLWVIDAPAGGVTVGSSASFEFTVPATSEDFRATLVWTDYPSSPMAGMHLVNDLDLKVTGPGGTRLGNVFSGGASTTGGSADRANTVEQVRLVMPAPGTYTVEVQAFNLPQGPQAFALVVSGAMTPHQLFADGFESGGLAAWSASITGP